MIKSKVLAALTLFFVVLAVVSTITLARAAHAAGADDVFMDEGDGDFDSVPKAKQADVEKPAPAKAVSQPEVVDTAPVPELVDDAVPAPSAPTEDPAAPAAAAPKEKKAKKKAKKEKKTAAVESTPAATGGSFVVTKEACPMMRTPASTGEPMLTIKASKKIWVEEAGDGWVKGWNKAGEAGYISKDCVK